MEEISIDSDLGLGQGFMPGAVSSEEFSFRTEFFEDILSEDRTSDCNKSSESNNHTKKHSKARRFLENLKSKAINSKGHRLPDCDCVANLGKMASKSTDLSSHKNVSSKFNHKKLFTRKKGLFRLYNKYLL